MFTQVYALMDCVVQRVQWCTHLMHLMKRYSIETQATHRIMRKARKNMFLFLRKYIVPSAILPSSQFTVPFLKAHLDEVLLEMLKLEKVDVIISGDVVLGKVVPALVVEWFRELRF